MNDVSHRDPAEDIFATLRRWAHGEDSPPPFRLFAYLTERCNLRCPSCGLATGNIVPAHDEMDDATVLSLAAQAASLGVGECYLTGGEVLVRKALVLSLMERIKAAGMRGILSTNGTLLGRADLQRVVAAGWDLLIVSLDGPEAAHNDPLRSRAGVFEDATKMIRAVVELRAQRSDGLPELHLHSVISRSNGGHLTSLVELCADLGVDYFAAEPIVRQSDACDAMMLDSRARTLLRDELPRALRRANAYGLSTNLAFLEDSAVRDRPTDTAELNAADVTGLDQPFAAVPCFVPFYNLVVHPNGAVGGCWQERDDSGPRLPEITLADAWQRLAPAALREAMLRSAPPAYCGRCCLINARDNRRYRALLLAEFGAPEEARAALQTALSAEPNLPLLRRAQQRLERRLEGGGDG